MENTLIKNALKKIYYILTVKHLALMRGCNIALYTVFEGQNAIGRNTVFSGSMGYGTYIGANSSLPFTHIGRFSSIANNVKVIAATHATNSCISSHPAFYSLGRQNGETFVSKQKIDEFVFADREKGVAVYIGSDVWVGDGSTIMGGITIGDGAVIAANATVTHDVAPYAIVGGIPAKVIGRRFDDNAIQILLKHKWWNMPIDWIRQNAGIFTDVQKSLCFFEQNIPSDYQEEKSAKQQETQV